MSRHKVLSKTKQLHDLQHRFPFFLSLSLHPLARSLVTTWSGKAVWRKHMLLNWTWFAHFPAAQAHFTCCPCCGHATHQHETRRLVQPLCMSHIKKSLLFSKFRCAKNLAEKTLAGLALFAETRALLFASMNIWHQAWLLQALSLQQLRQHQLLPIQKAQSVAVHQQQGHQVQPLKWQGFLLPTSRPNMKKPNHQLQGQLLARNRASSCTLKKQRSPPLFPPLTCVEGAKDRIICSSAMEVLAVWFPISCRLGLARLPSAWMSRNTFEWVCSRFSSYSDPDQVPDQEAWVKAACIWLSKRVKRKSSMAKNCHKSRQVFEPNKTGFWRKPNNPTLLQWRGLNLFFEKCFG